MRFRPFRSSHFSAGAGPFYREWGEKRLLKFLEVYAVATMKWNTRLLHEAQEPDPLTGSVNMPVYLTSTYAQRAPGKAKGFVYSRTGNPTRAALERVLGSLEGGVGSLAFASGLAAASALFMACLLYTSPSPRDPKTSRMPSSA